jgi:uncharacterized damage-inducible protein DinB
MAHELVALLYQSWDDLDHAVSGLTAEEATARHEGASSIAWTVGHVTHMVDSWLGVTFQGLPPHPLMSDSKFRAGGSGDAKGWPEICAGVNDVRQSARRLLDNEPDLGRVVPYDGSIAYLRGIGISVRYAVLRIAAHHFVHVGEIVTIRSRMGHAAPEFPDWGRRLVQEDPPPFPR